MRIKTVFLALAMMMGSTAAFADLEPWKDYAISDAVWTVTTIKVHSNMGDAYLEGLKKTWVASNEIAKKLGQIEGLSYFSKRPARERFLQSFARRQIQEQRTTGPQQGAVRCVHERVGRGAQQKDH